MKGVPVAGCILCRSSDDRGRVGTGKSEEQLKLEATLAEVERSAKEIIVEKQNAKRMIDSAKRSRAFAEKAKAAASGRSTDEDSMSGSSSGRSGQESFGRLLF